MNEILIIDNFLSKIGCDEIIDLFKSTPIKLSKSTTPGHIFWKNRMRVPIYSEHIYNKIYDERLKVTTQFFNEDLEIEYLHLVIWNVNQFMPLHNDSGINNYFHYRKYASLLYLNDDYDGGEICIPELNFKHKPKAGQLVSFPGIKYSHSVNKIERNPRYTSVCWFKEINNGNTRKMEN